MSIEHLFIPPHLLVEMNGSVMYIVVLVATNTCDEFRYPALHDASKPMYSLYKLSLVFCLLGWSRQPGIAKSRYTVWRFVRTTPDLSSHELSSFLQPAVPARRKLFLIAHLKHFQSSTTNICRVILIPLGTFQLVGATAVYVSASQVVDARATRTKDWTNNTSTLKTCRLDA